MRPLNDHIAAGCAFVVALLLASCGGSDDSEQPASIAGEVRPLKKTLVSEKDLSQALAGSPERAFLQYWSDLQFSNIKQAIALYDPRLRAEIGVARLGEALKTAIPVFRSSKPVLHRTERNGDDATIYYFAPVTRSEQSKGTVPLSITLRRRGDRWLITYDAALDTGLRASEQLLVQARVKGIGSSPDPRALAAGEAASRLQSSYLQELDEENEGSTSR